MHACACVYAWCGTPPSMHVTIAQLLLVLCLLAGRGDGSPDVSHQQDQLGRMYTAAAVEKRVLRGMSTTPSGPPPVVDKVRSFVRTCVPLLLLLIDFAFGVFPTSLPQSYSTPVTLKAWYRALFPNAGPTGRGEAVVRVCLRTSHSIPSGLHWQRLRSLTQSPFRFRMCTYM
jgi:hypothetical protein